jgi:hypothetical protein
VSITAGLVLNADFLNMAFAAASNYLSLNFSICVSIVHGFGLQVLASVLPGCHRIFPVFLSSCSGAAFLYFAIGIDCCPVPNPWLASICLLAYFLACFDRCSLLR